MFIKRTDLALEARELWQESAERTTRLMGVKATKRKLEGYPVTRVDILDHRLQTARELGIGLREGVYMYFPGPQYETPAEVRAARLLGADAVGMSTVPEAIVAAHCGMEVLGFTLCTNMAAGVLDQPLSSDEVIAAGQAAGPRFSALVKACLTRL